MGRTAVAEAELTLTQDERAFLTELLQTVLKETRVEEHRTRKLSYREHVLHKEDLINSILRKLGRAESYTARGQQ